MSCVGGGGERYGGDDVDGPRNEGRGDVGDGEVADADHLEVVESAGGEVRKVGQGEVEEVADLHNAARILFVFDDLKRRRRTRRGVHSPRNYRFLRRVSAAKMEGR